MCGLWFWVAFTLFLIVVVRHTSLVLPFPSHRQTSLAVVRAPLTTEQRMRRSELAWRDSVTLRHQMALAHPSHPHIPFFPAQKLDDFSLYPYTLWDFFPATYTCPHDIQRVGRLGDGGKWVCGMSVYESLPGSFDTSRTASGAPSRTDIRTKPSAESREEARQTIIYSFGVNDESTFEAEMLQRIPSAQVFAYDYSVESFGPQLSSAYASRAHFKKVGLGATDMPQNRPPFYSLASLMRQNGHDYMDILKIDIEGSEYAALDAFMDDCELGFGAPAAGSPATSAAPVSDKDLPTAKPRMPIGQIMIELHLVDDEHIDFQVFQRWWERLEGFGMRATWLEVNLLAVTLGGGKTDPRCVEYVWVNAEDERSLLISSEG